MSHDAQFTDSHKCPVQTAMQNGPWSMVQAFGAPPVMSLSPPRLAPWSASACEARPVWKGNQYLISSHQCAFTRASSALRARSAEGQAYLEQCLQAHSTVVPPRPVPPQAAQRRLAAAHRLAAARHRAYPAVHRRQGRPAGGHRLCPAAHATIADRVSQPVAHLGRLQGEASLLVSAPGLMI